MINEQYIGQDLEALSPGLIELFPPGWTGKNREKRQPEEPMSAAIQNSHLRNMSMVPFRYTSALGCPVTSRDLKS